jgi:hypothetical protein
MVETEPQDDDNSQATVVGCVVLLLTLAVIGAVAVPLVGWRDPETGRPLPRLVSIVTPVVAGALFFGLVTAILKVFGLSVLTKPKEPHPHDDVDMPPSNQQEPD